MLVASEAKKAALAEALRAESIARRRAHNELMEVWVWVWVRVWVRARVSPYSELVGKTIHFKVKIL